MSELSHLDDAGQVRMVDVGDKPATERLALAEGYVYMKPETLKLLTANELPKGNVLTTAHIAGVLAAKRTDQLIPLCHSLPLSGVDIEFAIDGIRSAVHIKAQCRVCSQTGVEMEALTAVSVAALTIYDMCKAVDKHMRIDGIRLLKKTGGKSGDFHAG
ncbi:cyclic pyranopterin monophosphate synthase MoaC [Permianibacter aggregans]|uniref:Cyclic pyranopterin monophosphate synthase n=1 Tax=Permianibacter aggregans TaxID=1510150 RepID=A0A4R6UYH1_9GAMM|nr:cyclic pyranopterin monophosphate synthase MoaC [Permianibacter aggregans]TDQ48684.1 cyclic pyranopterin monophosphate synthase subunit MoaC [Permianibacter aggregans]